MSTFVLIHGACDGGWNWHLVRAQLEARAHTVVAPDLPSDDETATFPDYAAAALAAVAAPDPDTVVVGHSLGAFTAPLVADALGGRLVLVAPMIPVPGERPGDWWENVGLADAVAVAAARDGGLTGHDDPLVSFLHDVEPALAAEALRRGRPQSNTPMDVPWDGPELAGRAEVVLCSEDRFFPADLVRRLAAERVGTVPHDIPASHCVALARPRELADLLEEFL